MMYRLEYHERFRREDLVKFPRRAKEHIRSILENRLTIHPEKYGKRLAGSLKNYWKLRIGDYRVIFKITGDVVRILMIGHRSTIYREIFKRLNQ